MLKLWLVWNVKSVKSDHNITVVYRDEIKWIQTRDGVLSVAEAIERDLKTTSDGEAVEARGYQVIKHFLYRNVDTIQTAKSAGWEPSNPLTSMSLQNATTEAVDYIMQHVDRGNRVRLTPHCQVVATLHLYNMVGKLRKIRASLRPQFLMRTSRVVCSEDNQWIESKVPECNTTIWQEYPYSLVGGQGFHTPAGSRWWPQLVSNTHCGNTGLGQVANLCVKYEKQPESVD
jgi:hypothetical protein